MTELDQRDGDTLSISACDPRVIIAGIRQFGLAPDGSDLRDLEAALAQPTPDAAEGAGTKLDCTLSCQMYQHDGVCCADDDCDIELGVRAPPKPAPDAMGYDAISVFAALTNIADLYDDREDDAFRIFVDCDQEPIRVLTLGICRKARALRSSAPVPSPDGALERARQEVVLAIAFLGRDSGTDRLQATVDSLIPGLVKADAILRSFIPLSGIGAAEPVAYRWRYENMRDAAADNASLPWSFVAAPLAGNVSGLEIEPLYATPTVRGDRETLLWAADVAAKGAKQCSDGDDEWHKGFRYAADNTALGIAADLQRAADALPVQSTARPDKEAAAQVIAKRHYGDKLENLEGVTRDNCRDTVTEIFELAGSGQETFKHDDVVRLVLAARTVAFGDDHGGEDGIRELDLASEQFAASIPWEDQPSEEEL